MATFMQNLLFYGIAASFRLPDTKGALCLYARRGERIRTASPF